MAKKEPKVTLVNENEVEHTEGTDLVLPDITLDFEKIDTIQKKLDEKVKEVSDKKYAISMTKDQLFFFTEAIDNVKWIGKEALGIVEIKKAISGVHEKGIKNNTIFLKALEIEASHYFLNKFSAKGGDTALEFVAVFKSLEQALSAIQSDSKEINDIKTELAAAQQGIVSE